MKCSAELSLIVQSFETGFWALRAAAAAEEVKASSYLETKKNNHHRDLN